MENEFIYKIKVENKEEGEKVFGLLSNLGIEWDCKLNLSLISLNLPTKEFLIAIDGFKFVTLPLSLDSISLKIGAKEITADKLQSEDFKKELLKIRILGRLQEDEK